MVEYRFFDYWERERAARERQRAALPASWRDDSLPRMHEVREAYVEAMLDLKRSSRVPAVATDDR